MKKYIKFYLYILPFYSLIGIIFSTFRTAYQDNYVQIFILISAIFDLGIIVVGFKHIRNKTITFFLLMMFISFVVGLLNNNELSRRYITDFTNPFFFFAKVFIFAAYWREIDFSPFLKYYVKVAFWGSLILLPVTYFLFKSAGATRLAIFPPMELPFLYHLQSGGTFFFISLLIILLYGKRAQLVGAIATFFIFTYLFKRREIFKYIMLFVIGAVGMTYVFTEYSENLAVKRLTSTIEIYEDSKGTESSVKDLSGSRAVEIESILKEMNGPIDYIFGKGFGYTYLFEFGDISKTNANAHFSPVALLSKYGLIFTLFTYYFILSIIFKRKRNFTPQYIMAVGTCLFVFCESFFAYALFVTPILPIALGYLIHSQKLKIRRNG